MSEDVDMTERDKEIVEKIIKTEYYHIDIQGEKFMKCSKIGYILDYSRHPPPHLNHIQEGAHALAFRAGGVLSRMHERGIVRKSPEGHGNGWKGKVVGYFPKEEPIKKVIEEELREDEIMRLEDSIRKLK